MQKRLRTVGFLFVCGFVCGLIGYFFGKGIAQGVAFKEVIRPLLILDGYVYLAQVASILLAGLTWYFLSHSRRDMIAYQKAEERDDEEGMDTFHTSSFRKLEYGTIAFNIFSISMIFSLFGGLYMVVIDFTHWLSMMIPVLLYIVLFFLLNDLQKTFKVVRNYDFPKFAMPEDALNLVRSYDEGEREANYENSFMTLFQLNQIVLPALYPIIAIISMILQEFQLLAFLIVAFIHIYINFRGIQQVKNYFK
ncbi:MULTISPECIES: DUF3169 family protein [Streptococcus]|nr:MULTISPECIES: DUF3169 family protein [unclassified Streptococcus]MWV56405.1 DUF3169 family protein [Streptococcus sp. zg-70]QTH47388.1 DUF3169 family protein [Streptococcus sp. zg-86]